MPRVLGQGTSIPPPCIAVDIEALKKPGAPAPSPAAASESAVKAEGATIPGCFDLGLAYVANFLDNAVSVVDVSRAREVTRVAVGAGPLGVGPSPDKRFVYVSNFLDATLSVIRTIDNQVVATIDLNSGPFTSLLPVGVMVSADSRFVYVANFGSNNVSVVDALRRQVVAEIPLTSGGSQLAITPDGGLLFVTLPGVNSVDVADLNVNLVVETIAVGVDPEGIAIPCTRPFAFVANQVSNDLSVLNTDLAEGSGATIPVGTTPTEVAFNPSGTTAYVTNQADDTVRVVDVFTHAQVLTIPVGTIPVGIGVAVKGLAVVNSNAGDNSVSIINALTNTVVATVPVGALPLLVGIV